MLIFCMILNGTAKIGIVQELKSFIGLDKYLRSDWKMHF